MSNLPFGPKVFQGADLIVHWYRWIDAVQLEEMNPLEPQSADEIALEVGKALMKICLNPDYVPEENGRKRLRSARIFNHGNGIEWAGERHTTQEEVFVWAANALRPISEVESDILAWVKTRVDREVASRGDGPADT